MAYHGLFQIYHSQEYYQVLAYYAQFLPINYAFEQCSKITHYSHISIAIMPQFYYFTDYIEQFLMPSWILQYQELMIVCMSQHRQQRARSAQDWKLELHTHTPHLQYIQHSFMYSSRLYSFCVLWRICANSLRQAQISKEIMQSYHLWGEFNWFEYVPFKFGDHSQYYLLIILQCMIILGCNVHQKFESVHISYYRGEIKRNLMLRTKFQTLK